MQMEKSKKACTSCETKYTVEWNIELQDLEPLTCPFCGHEVEEVQNNDEDETIWTNESEDDNWN